ncbi:PAS domain S-box-containing protein [Paracoccus sulfuroxidans]|uniref:histidine kinase n=1 Tax=Paracoccus sulfuroxidans TaxID=384678 RepID=A0A562N843_9RHOB|nr:PAS domain S-box-containing protein [Paracoccus sulfuroxidans]
MYLASMPKSEGGIDRLYADYDWGTSPLGAPGTWPASLRCVFETILDAKSQVVIFAGPEFVALYNDAYAPTIGNKHPQAFGRPARENWTELWAALEPMLQKVRREVQTVSARDLAFHIERHGYPETVHFDISYSPIRDGEEVAAVLCIVTETTERVRAQDTLAQSEARLRALFAQSAAGIALIDAQGRFNMVNARLCAMLGYSESDMLAMNYRDILHPDDRNGDALISGCLPQLSSGRTIEQQCIRKDGSSLWVAISGGSVPYVQGKDDRISLVMTDIGERRRAEADERRLAAIIASSTEAILSTDLQMRITSWNGGAERLYGYTASEAIGQLVTMLVPDDRTAEEAAIIAQIQNGHQVEPHETIRRCRDGRLVEVSLTVGPIYDEFGHVVGASKIARDIAERRRAERLQTVLVHEMKHRVKNILATVLAIARQTLGAQEGQAAETFRARLMALARAQDLVTDEQRDGAELCDIVTEVLSPYADSRFSIDGPAVLLPPKTALAFALGLHELATNAAKYGALSAAEGVIEILWRYDEEVGLDFTWRERGGPDVVRPDATGFGSVLIGEVLPAEFMGEVTIEYASDGLVCHLTAPPWQDFAPM